jgi:hypothetical protein
MADLERTMRVTTVLAVFILLMLYPGRARAQAVEVGAGVALSCKSLEQSPCAYKWGRVDAVHVAWWSSPSLVVEARAARLEGPTTRIVAVTERVSPTRYFSRSYTLRDERRTVLQASMLYHFRPGRPIRPFVGGGAGSLWWRGEAFCDRHQIDCQRVLPENAPGVLRAREWVASFAGGVRSVLADTAGTTLIGAACGLAGGLYASRFVEMMFEVAALDVWSLALPLGTPLLAALVAAAVPAWRAARVDPVIALRNE